MKIRVMTTDGVFRHMKNGTIDYNDRIIYEHEEMRLKRVIPFEQVIFIDMVE